MYIDLVNETCGTFHEFRELSIFTGASAGLFGILIILVNFPILFCIIRAVRRHEKKFQHFFYKLLICITLSDLLKGLLTAPATVSFCYHELHHENSNQDLDGLILHLAMLIPDAAALVTMTYLSFDRLLPLYFPNKVCFWIEKEGTKNSTMVYLAYCHNNNYTLFFYQLYQGTTNLWWHSNYSCINSTNFIDS